MALFFYPPKEDAGKCHKHIRVDMYWVSTIYPLVLMVVYRD